MALSAKDLARWRKRLSHAHRVWVEKGLIGTQHASKMRELNAYYRGEHSDFGGLWERFSDEMVVVNKVYSTINASVSGLAARNPEVQAIPRKSAAVEGARLSERLLQYDMEELQMIDQWNWALKDHHTAPMGFTRHGFTPQEEKFDSDGRLLEPYRAARPDRPWVKRLPIWDVLLDCLSDQFHMDGGMGWCAFRDMRTPSWFRRNENMTLRDDVKPNISGPFREQRPRDLLDDQNEDWNERVEFYWVYELEERTWFAITRDDGVSKPLRDREDWTIQWEGLPIDVLAIHRQMDSPFAIPLMEPALPIQIELDKLHTIMSVVARNTRRIIGASEAVPDDVLDKLEDNEVVEILRLPGNPRDMIQEIKAGGFPQELLLYKEVLEDELRETKGQGRMDRAQRINVESATEAAQVAQGSAVLNASEQVEFERFMSGSLRNYWHGRQQTMTQTELVPILGSEDAARFDFLEITPDDIKQDFEFRLVAGSSLPPDKNREVAQAAADIEVAGKFPQFHNLPEVFRRYWEKRRVDPDKVLVAPEQQQISDDAATIRGRTEEGAQGLDPSIATLLQGGGGGLQ